MYFMDGVLKEAFDVVNGPRRQAYGSRVKGHEIIAKMWDAYLKGKKDKNEPISAFDVSQMMILLKVARNAHNPGKDNAVDICGYSDCSAEIMGWQQNDPENRDVILVSEC